MTAANRAALTFLTLLAIILALATCGYLGGRWNEVDAQQLQPATLSKYEKQLIELDRQAIAEAYRDQIHHLFLTWAKDTRDQPNRAVTGARQARTMYESSMTAIDEREKRLEQGK